MHKNIYKNMYKNIYKIIYKNIYKNMHKNMYKNIYKNIYKTTKVYNVHKIDILNEKLICKLSLNIWKNQIAYFYFLNCQHYLNHINLQVKYLNVNYFN